MKFTIKARISAAALFTADIDASFESSPTSVKLGEAVKQAVSAKADLYGADLYGANLGGADLRSADLRSADLRSADLYGANLGGADLRSADLGGADLRSANLGGANLGGADLYGARVENTILDPEYQIKKFGGVWLAEYETALKLAKESTA